MTIIQFVSKPKETKISDLATTNKLKISDTKKPLDYPLYKIIGKSDKKSTGK